MCYDDIDEIGRRVEALRAAKERLAAAITAGEDEAGAHFASPPDLTAVELIGIYEARVARATARLNELVAPVKRVEPGDRAKEIEALNARKGLPSQEAST